MYFSKNNFPFSALLKFLFSSFMCFVFNIDELIFGLNQKGKKGKKKKKKLRINLLTKVSSVDSSKDLDSNLRTSIVATKKIQINQPTN